MKISNFGIILYPSTRSLAYLHMLSKNNIMPKEVIVMGKWPFLPENILIESKKYSYEDKYFSIDDSLEWIIKNKNITKKKFSITRISKSVPIKHLKASFTVQTIGSPLMLKEVLTKTGQPVISLNFSINL